MPTVSPHHPLPLPTEERWSPRSLTAVVSDLDGTLIRTGGVLSDYTVETLRDLREAGIAFVCATARTPRAVRRILGHEHLGRVVCANGGVVWDAGSDTIEDQVVFPRDTLAGVVHAMRRALPEAAWAVLSADTMYLDRAYAATRQKGTAGAVLVDHVCDAIADDDIVVVAVRLPGLLAADFLDVTVSGFDGCGSASIAANHTIDIVPAGVDKATTVQRLLTGLGHQPADAVAFGDMPNDLPMFAWAGYSFAVANAHPDVIAAADEIAPSNEEDGVAQTIRRLIVSNP